MSPRVSRACFGLLPRLPVDVFRMITFGQVYHPPASTSVFTSSLRKFLPLGGTPLGLGEDPSTSEIVLWSKEHVCWTGQQVRCSSQPRSPCTIPQFPPLSTGDCVRMATPVESDVTADNAGITPPSSPPQIQTQLSCFMRTVFPYGLVADGCSFQVCEREERMSQWAETQARRRAEGPAEVALLGFSFWEWQQRAFGCQGILWREKLPH